jgi:hypothetical protein
VLPTALIQDVDGSLRQPATGCCHSRSKNSGSEQKIACLCRARLEPQLSCIGCLKYFDSLNFLPERCSTLQLRRSNETRCMKEDLVVVVHVDGVRLCLWTVATKGPLFIPQVIYKYGETRWNDTDRGKPKN